MPATSNHITVLCRLPSGLRLDLYDTKLLKERASSTTPIVAPLTPRQSIMLNGAKHDPRFHSSSPALLGLAGRTEVDAQFWEAWRKQNPDFAPLKNGLIFAEKDNVDAEKALKERQHERTGFEGLDPTQLPGISPVDSTP